MALSQQFVNTVTPDASYFQTSGALLLALRARISILVDFSFPPGAIFNYLLYKTKLIPRWLAALGRGIVVRNGSFAHVWVASLSTKTLNEIE